MIARLISATMLLPFCLSACHRTYVVEITPQDGEMERTLTLSGPTRLTFVDPNTGETIRHADGVEVQVEVERIRGLYERYEPATESEGHVFTGRFKGRTPDDVGGAGSLTAFETQFGSASVYMERFRGTDDVAGELERRLEAADELMDLFAGWIEAELGKREGFGELRAFLHGPLRKDVKNLSVWLWRYSNAPADQDDGTGGVGGPSPKRDLIVRAWAYLCERGYFKPAELPAAMRFYREVFSGPDEAREKMLWDMVRRIFGRGLAGGNQKLLDEVIGLLKRDAEGAGAFSAYVGTTRRFEKFKRQWQAEHKDDAPPDADTQDPDAGELPSSLAADAFHVDLNFFLFPNDQIALRLNVPGDLVDTNGQWDEKARQATWAAAMDKSERNIPLLCYAMWASPDEPFQKRHFGLVVLRGSDLFDYCLWRKGLTEAAAARWDAFVDGLAPGKDLVQKLQAFAAPKTDGERPDPPGVDAVVDPILDKLSKD